MQETPGGLWMLRLAREAGFLSDSAPWFIMPNVWFSLLPVFIYNYQANPSIAPSGLPSVHSADLRTKRGFGAEAVSRGSASSQGATVGTVQ